MVKSPLTNVLLHFNKRSFSEVETSRRYPPGYLLTYDFPQKSAAFEPGAYEMVERRAAMKIFLAFRREV